MQRRFGRDGLEEANLRQRLALLYIQIDRPTDSARESDLASNDDRSTVGLGVGAFNLVRHNALAATPGLGYLRIRSDGGALAAHRMPVAAAVV